MSVITDHRHPYAAPDGTICSFCCGRLIIPYMAWLAGEMYPTDDREPLPYAGSVVGGHLFACQSCCFHIRSGFLEDLERVCELTGHPRHHETIYSLRRWKAAGGGSGLLTQ
jgi:hypothetical protein